MENYNILISLATSLVWISVWWLYKYKNLPKIINTFIEYIIPIILIALNYNNIPTVWFLVFSLLAYKIIDIHFISGVLLFLITYSTTSYLIIPTINLIPVLVSIAILAIMILTLLPIMKKDLKLIGCILYGLLAIVPLMLAFYNTKNIGLLGLIIGDYLLFVRQAITDSKKDKLIYTISNSFYYLGICFTPLAL